MPRSKWLKHRDIEHSCALWSTSPVECIVREMSDTAAQLELPTPQARSGALELFIPANGKKLRATVQSQSNDQLVIVFERSGSGPIADQGPARTGSEPKATAEKITNAEIAVLVVDDSRTTTRVIFDLLNNLGFADIDIVHDGQTALTRLKPKKYGLILSDWEMARP